MQNSYLRKAAEGDVDLLFRWANDPETRNNSFSTGQIAYEEHVRWYQNLLSREDAKQYLLVVDGREVGQVRVTAEGERATIGYSVGPDYRGRGYGSLMISLLPAVVRRDFPGVQVLKAEVKPANLASQKVFEANRFEEKCRVYELSL